MAIRKLLPIFCFLFCITNLTYAQDTPAKTSDAPKAQDEQIYQVVQEPPRFYDEECEAETDESARRRCAKKAMDRFLAKYVKYPDVAKSNVSGVKALRDIGGGCGQAVVDAVNKINEEDYKFVPGKQRGKPLRVQYNYPFKFVLY